VWQWASLGALAILRLPLHPAILVREHDVIHTLHMIHKQAVLWDPTCKWTLLTKAPVENTAHKPSERSTPVTFELYTNLDCTPQVLLLYSGVFGAAGSHMLQPAAQ
jgi:hypothetical protein